MEGTEDDDEDDDLLPGDEWADSAGAAGSTNAKETAPMPAFTPITIGNKEVASKPASESTTRLALEALKHVQSTQDDIAAGMIAITTNEQIEVYGSRGYKKRQESRRHAKSAKASTKRRRWKTKK